MEKYNNYKAFLAMNDEERDDKELYFEDVFRDLFVLPDEIGYSKYNRVMFNENTDSPKLLYRILYLFQDKAAQIGAAIQDDFYKNRCIRLLALDGRILICIDFYKYELHIYYYTTHENIISERLYNPKDEDQGKLFESLINDKKYHWDCLASDEINEAILLIDKGFNDTEYTIYAGNDFNV